MRIFKVFALLTLLILTGCSQENTDKYGVKVKLDPSQIQGGNILDSTVVSNSNISDVKAKLGDRALSLSLCGGDSFAMGKTYRELRTLLPEERDANQLYNSWELERKKNFMALHQKTPKQISSFWTKDKKELSGEWKELNDYSNFAKRMEKLKKNISRSNYPSSVITKTETLACTSSSYFSVMKRIGEKDGVDVMADLMSKSVRNGTCQVIKGGTKLTVLDVNDLFKDTISYKTKRGWIFAGATIENGQNKSSQRYTMELQAIRDRPPVYYYDVLRPFIKISPNNQARVSFVKKLIFVKANSEKIPVSDATKRVLVEQEDYAQMVASCMIDDNQDECSRAKHFATSMARIVLLPIKVEEYESIKVPCNFLNKKNCPKLN